MSYESPSGALFYHFATDDVGPFLHSDGYEAGNTVLGIDGMQDNQSSPLLDSTIPMQMAGGLNRWRMLFMVTGSGGIEITTGGDLVLSVRGSIGAYWSVTGATVVASTTFSTGPRGALVDLGDVVLQGSSLGRCTPYLTVRLYGGATINDMLFLPNCTKLSVGQLIGGDAASGDPTTTPVSAPTEGFDFSVATPLSGVQWAIGFVTGTSPGFQTYNPVVDNRTEDPNGIIYGAGSGAITPSVGGDWNFFGRDPGYGTLWGTVAGSLFNGVDANIGDLFQIGHYQYYFSQPPVGPTFYYGNPASVLMDSIYFYNGSNACHGGPPILQTQHRSYQPDENRDGEDSINANAGFPTGLAFSDVHFRSSQPDESTDGP